MDMLIHERRTPRPGAGPITLERLFWVALLSLLVLVLQAQEVQQAHQDDTEKIAVGDLAETQGHHVLVSCLELMPDGHTLLVATSNDHPIQVMDTRDWSLLRTIGVTDYSAGPDVQASSHGTYLLLRKKFHVDWAVNKDRMVKHEVLDFATGNSVMIIANAHDAVIAPDEQRIYSLEGENVTIRQLPGGEEIGRIQLADARNSLAISPDGKLLAVSHRPTAQLLEKVPSVRNDKRSMKPALKYREMVSVFNTADGKLVGTVADIYDVIYDMTFSTTGDRLLLYSIPHSKLNDGQVALSAPVRQGIVNMVAMPSLEPLRTGYMSAMNEPQIEPNLQGDRLALASTDGFNKRKLYVYDMATGEFTLDLDLDQRWLRDIDQQEYHDGSVPYHFLSDGRTLVLGSGASLRSITTH